MSGSRTIIEDDDRLDNIHPGSILREDFLIGSEIPAVEVTDGAGIPLETIDALLAEIRPIDADIDLRLARYFGMSEGFFLGLQIDFDVEEAKRAIGSELDRIVQRAA